MRSLPSLPPLLLLLLLAVLCGLRPLNAQLNGTDPFPPTQQSSCVYRVSRTYSTPAPLSFEPASPALTPSDDGYDVVSLGFSFTFYGVQYTSVVVSSNGNFQFTTSSSSYTPSGLPQGDQSLSPFIALFYTDLFPTVPGMKTYATLGAAPYRSFIVRYLSVPYYGSYTGNFTGDVIVYETSNTIEMRYYNATVDTAGHNVVIGVDGAGVQVATQSYDYLAVLNAVQLNDMQAAELTGYFSLVFSLQSPLAANPFACFEPAASAYSGGGASVPVVATCTNPGDLTLLVSATTLQGQQSAGVNVSLPADLSFVDALPCFSNEQSDTLLKLAANVSWSEAAFNSSAANRTLFVQFLVSSIPPLCRWSTSVVQGAYLLGGTGSAGLVNPAGPLINCPTPPYLSPGQAYQLNVSFDYGASFFAIAGNVSVEQPAITQATTVGTTLTQSVPQLYLDDGSMNLTWTTSAFGSGPVDVLVYTALPFVSPLQPKYRDQRNSYDGAVQVFTAYYAVTATLAAATPNSGALHLSAAAVAAAWPSVLYQIQQSFIAIVLHTNTSGDSGGSRRLLQLGQALIIYDILRGSGSSSHQGPATFSLVGPTLTVCLLLMRWWSRSAVLSAVLC